MSTQSTTTVDPLVECEKHWVGNCALCNHPAKRPHVRHSTPVSAVGTTKVEVASSIASYLDLPLPDFSTSGPLVAFFDSLAAALSLEPGHPSFVAEQLCFRAEVDWLENCATSKSHVTLAGLLKVRDAVVRLHRGEG